MKIRAINMLQLYTAMVFNQFKMVVQFFWTASSFPNFDGPNDIFTNSTGHWPRLQKGRKIPGTVLHVNRDIKGDFNKMIIGK